jgi:hypothetical protein
MMGQNRDSGGGLYEEFGCPADTFLDGAMVHLDSLNARGAYLTQPAFSNWRR